MFTFLKFGIFYEYALLNSGIVLINGKKIVK